MRTEVRYKKTLGTRRVETRTGQGEGEPSDKTSKERHFSQGRKSPRCATCRRALVTSPPCTLRPNMGAGGSHSQAKMMQEASAAPVAARNLSATPAVSSPFLETQSKGKGRGARSWSVLELQDAAALV